MPSVDRNLTSRLLAEDKFHTLLLKLKRIFLYQIKDKNLKEELDTICTELKKINLSRNDFIHAIFVTIGENEIRRFKLKPDIHLPFGFEQKSLKLEDIENFAERIIKAKESLSVFNEKIIKLIHPKPTTINVLSMLKKPK